MTFAWTDPLGHAAVLLAALAWDRWLGEPPAALHPVVWMGRVIGWFRRRAPKRDGAAFVWGLVMAAGLPVLFAGLAGLTVLPLVGPVLAVWLLTSCFAIRGLGEAGARVATHLEADDLSAGRAGLSWLCSRDPSELDATQVAAAALESVAENSSDSAVAPILFYVLGGLPAALAYRCVNTLDAMVGYRGALEWLGKASARLDDLANLIPARITGLLLLIAAMLRTDLSPGQGLRVMLQDHGKTESPNAGWPMAAMAGIVGVQLEKQGHYVLGRGLRPCDGVALARGVVVGDLAMTGWGLIVATVLLGGAWI